MSENQSKSIAAADPGVRALFEAASVAVVGATEIQGKWGQLVLQHIIAGGYEGRVYPVNPKYESLYGLPCYPSVSALPEAPELAIIGVRADVVPTVVKECGDIGCSMVVVVTSGFRDAGSVGRRKEDDLVKLARSRGVRLLGPNGLGIYAARSRLYASVGLEIGSTIGGVSLVSQSGNVGVGLYREGARLGLGLHSFIGMGNQADVDFSDVLEYLRTDSSCTVVALYVEGIRSGPEFFSALRKCADQKPVLVLKGGVSSLGASAAQSHTGSLASDGRVFLDLVAQAGGCVISTLDELVSTSLMMSKVPHQRCSAVSILTDGGGYAVLAADECEQRGLRLARVSTDTQMDLSAVLPPYCTVGNPTDVGGDSDSNPGVFGECADLLLRDPGVEALLVTGILGGYDETFDATMESIEFEAAIRLLAAQRGSGKAVVVHSVWPVSASRALGALTEGGIPVLPSLAQSVRGLATLDRYAAHRSRRSTSRSSQAVLRRRIKRLVAPEEIGQYGEPNLYALMRQLGVSTPDFVVVSSLHDAEEAFEYLGAPVVVKAISTEYQHKSEIGGVQTNVFDADALGVCIPVNPTTRFGRFRSCDPVFSTTRRSGVTR
jgi:acyl-CoA synthetase (NDP forming)